MKYKVYATEPTSAFDEWKDFVNKMKLNNIKVILLKTKRDEFCDIFTFIYKQERIKPVQVVIDTKGKVRNITTLRSYTIGFFNGLFIGLIVGFIFLVVVK